MVVVPELFFRCNLLFLSCCLLYNVAKNKIPVGFWFMCIDGLAGARYSLHLDIPFCMPL